MKRFFPGAFAALACFFLLAVNNAGAQSSIPGLDPAVIMKLFGDTKAFSTDAEFSTIETNGTQSFFMPMEISELNGQIRYELQMEKVKSTIYPPELLTQMKSMGTIINVIKPDTKTMIIIYPAMTAYLQTPIPKEQADAMSKPLNIQKTKLGAETINGHSCVKSAVIITADDGQKQQFTMWTASDLHDFPLKLESMTSQGKLSISYKNPKLEKPDGKLFEATPGYTKYASEQEFQEAIMKKMMGGAPAPK